MEQPNSIEELQQLIRSRQRLQAVGGGTKSGLLHGVGREVTLVSTHGFRGMLEYEPSEFTFTAKGGTPLSEVEAALAEQGQYLPFDPPLVAAGATLGGTVAAGLSGSGRAAYGGLRDFLLGVRLVNGCGNVVYGGGKVVKNAAGFDIPKLNVGAMGLFGVMVEFTFKVFPWPQRMATIKITFDSMSAATRMLMQLGRAPLDLKCLDYEPPAIIWLRCGGREESLLARVEAIRGLIAQLDNKSPAIEVIEDDSQVWHDAREFSWRGDFARLAKVPITPKLIEPLEQRWEQLPRSTADLRRLYCVGGNLMWLAWPMDLMTETLDDLLCDMQLSGLGILGEWPRPRLGVWRDNVFTERLRHVFDPQGKFTVPGIRCST